MKFIPLTKAFLLLCFSLSACTQSPPRSAATLAARQPVDARRAAELSGSVQEIASAQAQIRYLSAFAQIRVERGKELRSFDAALQVAPPDKLALLVLSDLGQEMARVVADGSEVLFEDFEKDETRRFAQDGEALRKALRLPLTVEDLVDRILLRLPVAEILQVERENSSDIPPAHWVLRRGDALRLVEGGGPSLSLYQARDAGKKWRYEVEYSDYAEVETRRFPRRIAIGFRKPALQLTLRLQEISFAPPASRGIEASFDTKNH